MTDCRHERSQIADSRFHGHSYSTPASRAVFCDDCRIRRWLEVEAVLAESEAAVGLIPAEAATAIAAAARSGDVDFDAIAAGIRATCHSLVAVLRALQAACPDGAGEYVHYGATTQDIQDTGQALEMRDVLDAMEAGLRRVLVQLVTLAGEHRDTLMIARTHARPALPTTFGLKVAGWADELLRQAERVEQCRRRVLVAQLAGGVGTMAGFGEAGPELLVDFAGRLGLAAPRLGWHVARDRVAEFVTTLASVAASLARIADEIRTLSQPEFAELEQGWVPGHVGSSTMPHKRNPEQCQQVVTLARLARASAGLALEAMIGEHERDGRSLRLEWAAVADVSHHTLAALDITAAALDGLLVHADHMAAEARAAAEAICSEVLMLALGAHVGKQSAHALVYELSQAAQSEGVPLRVKLDKMTELEAWGLDLDAIFDPARHLGSAGVMVDAMVADVRAWLDERGGSRDEG